MMRHLWDERIKSISLTQYTMRELIDLYDIEDRAKGIRGALRERGATDDEWVRAEQEIAKEMRMRTERGVVDSDPK